jgi:hypothetical protein
MTYLTVDEQSTYIDVACDGYVLRVYTNGTAPFIRMYDTTLTTYYGRLDTSVLISASTYSLYANTTRVTTVVENTSSRVVISIKGNLQIDSGAELADSSLSVTLFVYSDKVVAEYNWTLDSSVTTASDLSHGFLDFRVANGTTITKHRENAGVESIASDYSAYNTADYIACFCDEQNVQVAIIDDVGSLLDQYSSNAGSWRIRINDKTIGIGTHRFVFAITVDSAEREGSAKLYTSTNRLTLGTQYHDITSNANLATIDTYGDFVTDLNIPDMIDSAEGFASDGGTHVDLDTTHDAKLTINQTEINRVDVLHEASVRTGSVSSPTEHLIGHWKCDDNAASTVVVDETGNYNGTLVGGDNTSVLSNTDAVRGRSLLMNGTDDYIDLSSALAGLSDDDKFTIKIKFKPAFSFNDTTGVAVFYIGSGSTDRIGVYYNYGYDEFSLYNNLSAAGEENVFGDAYTSDTLLQEYHTLVVSFDLSNDLVVASFNGVVSSFNITESRSSALSFFYAGYSNTSIYGEIYISSIKLIDGCILPYGTLIPGNVNGSDTAFSYANSDITTFIQAAVDGASLKIGSGTADYDGTVTLVTGPDGVANSAFYLNDTGSGCAIDITGTGNLDASGGQFAFWFASESSTIGYLFADGADYHHFCLRSSGSNLQAYWGNGTFTFTDALALVNDTNWHYIRVIVDKDADEITLEVDGVAITASNTVNDRTVGSTFRIGTNTTGTQPTEGYYHGITIAPLGVPILPFVLGANGGPVHAPLVSKNGSLITPGTSYQLVWGP